MTIADSWGFLKEARHPAGVYLQAVEFHNWDTRDVVRATIPPSRVALTSAKIVTFYLNNLLLLHLITP